MSVSVYVSVYAGLDKLLQMQQELQPEEMSTSFTLSKLTTSTTAADPPPKNFDVMHTHTLMHPLIHDAYTR